MKEVIMSIPDMQSTHCQSRVSNAIKGIEGAQIQNLEAGEMTVSITALNIQEEVVHAIEKAGYTVLVRNHDNSSASQLGVEGI